MTRQKRKNKSTPEEGEDCRLSLLHRAASPQANTVSSLSLFFFFFASAVSRNKGSLKKRFFFYFSPNVLASGRTLPPGKSRRRNTREVSFRANTAQQKKNTGCSPQLCCEGCEDNAHFCSLLKKISERHGVNFTAVKL